jgi:hypothetical protein
MATSIGIVAPNIIEKIEEITIIIINKSFITTSEPPLDDFKISILYKIIS